jgi:arginyl-tRNA synthetase
VITRDLRAAIARAVAEAGFGPAADPGLRPGGAPGRYSSSVAFGLAQAEKRAPDEIAAVLAAALAREPWIAQATVTGTGYVTIAVTPETLAARVTAMGPDSARGDALRGTVVTMPAGSWEQAATWEEARKALAAELTARLAAAAGATVAVPPDPERAVAAPSGNSVSPAGGGTAATAGGGISRAGGGAATPLGGQISRTGRERRFRSGEERGEVAAAVAFAGADAVRFALARAMPGRRVRLEPAIIARHVLENPAYAVRYAHARAASGVRWAAALGAGEASSPRLPADPADLALLDVLSWLPERVATAARRGRPDEFARYLENLAGLAVAALTAPSNPGNARAPGTDKLALAKAAQAGLAAGLGLLGVSAPDRL